MNYFNNILNGNIPANIFDLIKHNKFDYKLNQEYSYLQINANNTNNNTENSLYIGLVKKSMNLHSNNIISSVDTILKKVLKITIENNKNEIAKLTNSNDMQKNIIINLIANTFSNELYKIIANLPLTHQYKDLHIKLIELSGLTGVSIKAIKNIAEKLSLDYELTKTLKINKSINIHQLFYNVLIRDVAQHTCSDISVKCLITDEYINQLAITIINSWGVILDNIIKSIKYEKIILFYAFSIDFVDKLHQTTHNTKPRIIEHALDIGNTTINSDTKRMKDLKEKSKEINQSKVIDGVAKLLSSSITSAVSKNQADLLRTIAVSNEISMEKVKGSSFKFSGVKQTSTITQETNMDVAQAITNKVTNDISKNMKENIDMAAKTTTTDMKKFEDTSKAGTNYGGVIDSVANAATKILSASIGNTTVNKTEEEITKELKEQFKLNQDFKYNKNSEASDLIQNTLSSDNLAKCAADTKANNKINFKDLNISGAIEISDVEQSNVVNDVMNCAFDQAVINDIASKIVSEYESTIKQLLENVDSTLDEQTKATIEGDIYAIGTAGSAILESVGNAGSKIIDSGGTAAAKTLDAAGGVIKEGGEAAKNLGIGLMMGPLSILLGIITVFVIIGGIGYAMTKLTSGPENSDGVTSDMNNMNGDTSDTNGDTSDMNNINGDTNNMDMNGDDLRGDFPTSDNYSDTSNNNMDSFNKNY
jgi:hypothetical protein